MMSFELFESNKWPQSPLRGWYGGNYWRKCMSCGDSYSGGKRSTQCYPCALKANEYEVEVNLGSGI